jgi:ketosteroid isomerase-like protein
MDTDVARLKDAYAALGRGDESAALAMLAPDCEWRESAELPGADVLRGREKVAEFLRIFLESWERFEQVVEDVVTAGDRIGLAIHLTAVGRASGVGARVDAYRDAEALRPAVLGESSTPATASPSDSAQNAT